MTIHSVRALTAIAVLGASVACSAQARQSSVLSPAVDTSKPVCYRLHVGPWFVAADVQSSEQLFIPPTPELLVLDTTPSHGFLGSGPPFRLARGVARDTAWAHYERSHWSMWARFGDSLHVVVGELGWELVARERHDSLSGRAEVISDMGGLRFPVARVSGVRATCRDPAFVGIHIF